MLNQIANLIGPNGSVSIEAKSAEGALRITVIPRISPLADDAAESHKNLHALLARPFVAVLSGPDFDAEFAAQCDNFNASRAPAVAAMLDISEVIAKAQSDAKAKADAITKGATKKSGTSKAGAATPAKTSTVSSTTTTAADAGGGDDDDAQSDDRADSTVTTDSTDLFS